MAVLGSEQRQRSLLDYQATPAKRSGKNGNGGSDAGPSIAAIVFGSSKQCGTFTCAANLRLKVYTPYMRIAETTPIIAASTSGLSVSP